MVLLDSSNSSPVLEARLVPFLPDISHVVLLRLEHINGIIRYSRV